MNFELEYARSGRAACKVCQSKIDKDSLRIGAKPRVDKESSGAGDSTAKTNHILESTRWHHFRCFPKMRGVKWFKDNLPDPSECAGFEALKAEDQQHITALFGRCKGLDVSLPQELLCPPSAKSPHPSTPAMDKKGRGQKRVADSNWEVVDDSTMSPEQKSFKLVSKSGLSVAQAAELERQKLDLAEKSSAQLGAMLVKNGMAKTGKKDELVDRVAECRILGALPICPACEKVRLRFNRDTFAYSCPGYFDDDARRRIACKGPAKDLDIRRAPWQELFPPATNDREEDGAERTPAALSMKSSSRDSVGPASTCGSKSPSIQTLLFQKPVIVKTSDAESCSDQLPLPVPEDLASSFSIEVLTCSSDLPSEPSFSIEVLTCSSDLPSEPEATSAATLSDAVGAVAERALAAPISAAVGTIVEQVSPEVTAVTPVRCGVQLIRRSKYFT